MGQSRSRELIVGHWAVVMFTDDKMYDSMDNDSRQGVVVTEPHIPDQREFMRKLPIEPFTLSISFRSMRSSS